MDEQIDGIHYTWFDTPVYSGNGVGRVLNMAAFVWRLFVEGRSLSGAFKPDVVIASSTYPMDIWPAHRIARMAGAKLVFEVHDLWPLSPMELGGMSKWHPFIMLVQSAEDFAYRKADAVISMLPMAAEYMVSRGMPPASFHYVPNGIDADEWENTAALPVSVEAVLRQVRGRGLPIIAYAGTHGLANALDTLLDAAKLGVGKFEVVLVGSGPERGRLLQRVETEQIGNVTMLPAIPKEAIPALLKSIDFAFIGLLAQPLFRFGISPNKLVDYMMAGKPIIMAIKAGNDPVSEAGCGLTVAPADPAAICAAILKLANLPAAERDAMGANGRRYVQQAHLYPVLAKRFIEAMP